jgi:hypothetical protein
LSSLEKPGRRYAHHGLLSAIFLGDAFMILAYVDVDVDVDVDVGEQKIVEHANQVSSYCDRILRLVGNDRGSCHHSEKFCTE